MLGHFWPQITLRKKNKQNKLKGKLILFLLKIFLSLLYKFLLSGFYVMVIFKITSGTTCYISSKPPGSYYSTMDLKLMQQFLVTSKQNKTTSPEVSNLKKGKKSNSLLQEKDFPTSIQQRLFCCLFFSPRVEKETKAYQCTLDSQKIKRQNERSSSVLIRHSLLRKMLLTFFCPENGGNFHSFPQQFYTVLLSFFPGSNPELRHAQTLMRADLHPGGLGMAREVKGSCCEWHWHNIRSQKETRPDSRVYCCCHAALQTARSQRISRCAMQKYLHFAKIPDFSFFPF